MKRRIWSHAEGPYGHRVRVFLDPECSAGNICVEIRDVRRPGEERWRTLSLRHNDKERAIKYAKVMAYWWIKTGKPPRIVWRKQRGGPKPKGALIVAA